MKQTDYADEIYSQWLGGKSLREKMKTLQSGKLVQCIICDQVFFDVETKEDWQPFACKPKYWHDYADYGRFYTVLKRGFRGPCWVVLYSKSQGVEKAILNFFKNKCTTRPTDIGPKGGLR